MATSKERLEKEIFCLKQEMGVMQQTSDFNVQELNNSRENMAKMSEILSSKNAKLSFFKLNEERLILDNNKYQKEFKKIQETSLSQGEQFESIRSTLKEVLDKDNDICKNAGGSLESISNDAQVCDTVNFMIKDYVDTKKQPQSDVETTNEQQKSYNVEIQKYKRALLDLVIKIKAQTEQFRSNEKQVIDADIEKYQKKHDVMQRKVTDLGEKLIKSNGKIREMTSALAKSKIQDVAHQKLIVANSQLKEREGKLIKETSDLKKELLALKTAKVVKTEVDLAANESKLVQELKAEMARLESEHFITLQKYVKHLGGMKEQVRTFILAYVVNDMNTEIISMTKFFEYWLWVSIIQINIDFIT